MNKRQAMRLVNALRSGKFKQTQRRLGVPDKGHCCLGVACELAKAPKQLHADLFSGGDAYLYGSPGDFRHADLPDSVRDLFGFADSQGSRRDGEPIRINGESYESLMEANDDFVSFKRIATYIEKNYKYL